MIISISKTLLGGTLTQFCSQCEAKTEHNIETTLHDVKVYACSKCGSRITIELEDENE